MHGSKSAHDRVIANLNVARQSAVIGKNDVIADIAIVSDMTVGEKISASCRSAFCRRWSCCD